MTLLELISKSPRWNAQYMVDLFYAFGWTSWQTFNCHYDNCYSSDTSTEEELLEDGWRKDEDGYTCPECIKDEIVWERENGKWRYWFRFLGLFIRKYRRRRGVYFDGNYEVQPEVMQEIE